MKGVQLSKGRKSGFIKSKRLIVQQLTQNIKIGQRQPGVITKENKRKQKYQCSPDMSWEANLPYQSNLQTLEVTRNISDQYKQKKIYQIPSKYLDSESSSDLSPYQQYESQRFNTIAELTQEELSGYSRQLITNKNDDSKFTLSKRSKTSNNKTTRFSHQQQYNQIISLTKKSNSRWMAKQSQSQEQSQQQIYNPQSEEDLIDYYKPNDFKKKIFQDNPQIVQKTTQLKEMNFPLKSYQIPNISKGYRKYQQTKNILAKYEIDQFTQSPIIQERNSITQKTLRQVKSAPRLVPMASKKKSQKTKKQQLIKRRQIAKQYDRINRMKLKYKAL